VVDEYETGYALAKHRTAKPLTLREIIKFINRTNRDDIKEADRNGLVITVLSMNLDFDPDPESYLGFVSVHSSFYPELNRFFDTITTHYLVSRMEDAGEEPEEEEGPSPFSVASKQWDLQRLPEDPVIRPMLISHGVPRNLWPEGVISSAQAGVLIKQYGN
jgi:hypothetical protein